MRRISSTFVELKHTEAFKQSVVCSSHAECSRRLCCELSVYVWTRCSVGGFKSVPVMSDSTRARPPTGSMFPWLQIRRWGREIRVIWDYLRYLLRSFTLKFTADNTNCLNTNLHTATRSSWRIQIWIFSLFLLRLWSPPPPGGNICFFSCETLDCVSETYGGFLKSEAVGGKLKQRAETR